jgi:DNA-directed RNA polymerase subunit E'/Rpb7
MSRIIEQLLTTNLYLSPKNINHDIDNIIKHEMKKKYEGLCFEHGYIIPDTIDIIHKSVGKLKTENNKSKIIYNIKYKVKTIFPTEGDELDVYINNKNKLGIISYIKLGIQEKETFEESPLIIIIPNEYIIQSSLNIDDIFIGQKIKVYILGCRIKYNSDKIQVIAKPI